MANIIFSGNAKRMYEIAFGDQEIDYAKRTDNGYIQRSESIEQWAQDMYRFACGQWGEENIVQFICHLDEKSPHLHVTIVPVTEQKKVSFKQVLAGEDKFAFSRHMRELHDKLAEVNARWGLALSPPSTGDDRPAPGRKVKRRLRHRSQNFYRTGYRRRIGNPHHHHEAHSPPPLPQCVITAIPDSMCHCSHNSLNASSQPYLTQCVIAAITDF